MTSRSRGATLFSGAALAALLVVLVPDLVTTPSAVSGSLDTPARAVRLDDVIQHRPAPKASIAAKVTPKTKPRRAAAGHVVVSYGAPRKKLPIPNVRFVRANVDAVGDSVMEGAAPQLRARVSRIYIDAVTSQQVSGGIRILRGLRDAHKLGSVVVIHLGTNGRFLSSQFDDIMKVLSSVKKVVFVNVKAARSWETGDNRVIAAGVHKYGARAVLVDWHSRWRDCSGTVFYTDGIHLTPNGAKCYARLVAATI